MLTINAINKLSNMKNEKEGNENKEPKKVLKKAKMYSITPVKNIGSNADGSPKYKKGVSIEVTKKQYDNYKLNKIIK